MFRPLTNRIIHLDTVDSTNNYAAMLLSVGKGEHGTVILADEQTAGRGQRGAIWEAQPGFNLTFSFIIKPVNLSASDQFLISKLVGLALVDLLAKFGISASIKWPNDILVQERKIAGVLIENTLSGGKVQTSIIGIGLNVNQPSFQGLNATSMFQLTGNSFNLTEVLFSFLESFGRISLPVKEDFTEIDEAYLKLLYGFGSSIQLNDATGDFLGEIQGVDESGRLIVFSRGTSIKYELKELRFISQSGF